MLEAIHNVLSVLVELLHDVTPIHYECEWDNDNANHYCSQEMTPDVHAFIMNHEKTP